MSFTEKKTYPEALMHTAKALPDKPGVYLFFDSNKKIIYIGKAKNLKKRVNSYFIIDKKAHAKLRLMVSKIANLEFIIVDSEYDALLLENTLIKKWQPRYNVLLKDDKTFPWICIKNERFPRIFPTRKIIKDGSEYYGPFTSVKTLHVLLDLIKQIYKTRNCNYNLSDANIKSKKFKVCMEYHIGNCRGSCEGLESEQEYNITTAQIRHLIKGNISAVVLEMKKMMRAYAKDYNFENAQILKEKIDLIVNHQNKSAVVSAKISNVDVFSIVSDVNIAFVNYLKVINGAVVQSHTVELKKKLNEKDDTLLGYAIMDMRLKFRSTSKELIVPLKPDVSMLDAKYTVPRKGDKKLLLELSERNVKYYLMEFNKNAFKKLPVVSNERIMKTLMQDIKLNELPVHIECFDISNMQGSNSVASMVVFKNARPSKRDYRIFTIKTVEGPNDFASIEEVVFRRYSRLIDEGASMPQLIIVDGGKGQLSAAVKSLEKLKLSDKLCVIGIAKKLEEIFFPNDSIPLYLDKRSESLKLIQYMRNEAHRFGIKHYRKKTEKQVSVSVLDNIKGIGPKSIEKLFIHFKSVNAIRLASLEEIKKVINPDKAAMVFTFFNSETKDA